MERTDLLRYLLECLHFAAADPEHDPEDHSGDSTEEESSATAINFDDTLPYGTFATDEQQQQQQVITLTEAELLNKFKWNEREGQLLSHEERKCLPPLNAVHSVPVQILDMMSLTEVHMLFINLKLSEAYVTRNGQLVGVITRDRLKYVIKEYTESPKKLLQKLCKFYCNS